MIAVLFTVLGLVVTFISVVAIHELGHYFAARLVGVKAEVFSIGFGKTLFSKTDKAGMTWQIAALPIGGYVRFVGDENAASLRQAPDAPALPGSLRSVSKRAQAFVAISGPLANLLLAMTLFIAASSFSQSISYPWRVVEVSPQALKAGFQIGDEIIEINNIEITPHARLEDSLSAMPASNDVYYRVSQDGVLRSLRASRLDAPIVGSVASGSPADLAKIKIGDAIRAVDGQSIVSWTSLQKAVSASAGKSLELVVENQAGSHRISVAAKQQKGRWLLGLNSQPLLQFETRRSSLNQAVSSGIKQTGQVLVYTATGLTATILGHGELCELNGPITISRVAGQAMQLGPEIFLTFVAVISLGLGILNLLPIPILDGGHLLSLAVEGITKRPLGQKSKAILFILGVTGIAWLSIMAMISDLTC